MPAIRDSSWAFETLTTDAGITISLPNHESGDLLLLFAMADTGTPTWTLPSGYTQVFARNNTVPTICAYKISSGATEPTSVTVNANINETYNGIIISIQDINQTNPFGNPAVQTNSNQAAAAKYSMDAITTNVNNSLVIYFVANSSTGVPSLLEGPVFGLLGADGGAESMGIGWGFQARTGTTPTVTCSNVTTGAGVKATLQIVPPSTGATIIPTYCVTDLSTYLSPINGTTAYNGDTALAATADTGFGTTLGGITAVDATVGESADNGINSFHSLGQLTSAASANMAGAENVFAVANRPNVGTKNILCHLALSSTGQLQRIGRIASTRGVWFGMRSGSATDYKIWQVFGSDSPDALNRFIPIVINSAATNTVATGGTLNTAAIQSFGWWVSSSAVGTSIILITSLWLMDKTTIGGGNVNSPITIDGIIKTVSEGKERRSAILQGNNQMLLLQEVEIGNGGTNPVYLNLDGTAIEFPSQFNRQLKLVNYNSTDNKVGLSYYAGTGDTITHKNSLISSRNRYTWGINNSSSTGATYDFSGLSVVGASTISLNLGITLSDMTINDYQTLSVSGLTLTDSSILNVPTTNDSVLITTATTFNGCLINVSRVTSGNRWVSTSNPSKFVDCTFIGGGGHAMRITTPGTYTFNSNTFTNFGSTGTNTAAIFNDSGGLVTINVTNGGDSPTYRNGTNASTIINNSVTLSLTGLISDSEIRIFTTGTTPTELAGIESSTTTFDYTYSYVANTYVNIVIHKETYEYIRIDNYLLTASNTSIPIQQRFDRNYINP